MNTNIKSSKTLIQIESINDNLKMNSELIIESDNSISNLNASIFLIEEGTDKHIANVNRSKQEGELINFSIQCSESYNDVVTQFFNEAFEDIKLAITPSNTDE